MLRCGKYKGKAFEEVAREDRLYCAWVLRLSEGGSRNLMAFAEYLKKEHGGVLPFGAHKGAFFDELLREQPGYCTWAVDLASPSKSMQTFAEYVKKHASEVAKDEHPKKKARQCGEICCRICMDRSINTALSPCGHVIACLQCVEMVERWIPGKLPNQLDSPCS